MTDRTTPDVRAEESDVAPSEAFALLADPGRFGLLEAIAESDQVALPFNVLYERSEYDDSGQFNYHLDKLVGPFVRKTDDGYELRHAARIVYRLAVSGLFSDRGEAELTGVETACEQCGAEALRAVYEGDRFWVRCGNCDRRAAVSPFPPRALANYDVERAPTAFDRYTMGSVLRAVENVCPWCASPLSASLESVDDGWPAVDWVVRRSCDHCHGWIYTRVHDLLRFHPGVIAFYDHHGIDVLGSSFWEAEVLMADQGIDVGDCEEWAATVTIAYEGEAIELGIADDLRASTVQLLETGL